jgi:endonuclease/exonuclease/phosphatase (EEP) superfamily protein YafD
VLCIGAVVTLAALFTWGSGALVEGVRYLPLPLAAVPLVLAFLLSIGLGWRWRVATGAALLLFVFRILDFSLGGLWPDEEGTRSLRLMTWNAKAFKAAGVEGGHAHIAWEVALHDADVVMLQDSPFDSADQLPAPLRAAFAGREVFLLGQYVIASRHPLHDCRAGSIDYGGQPHRYLRCVIQVGAMNLDLVNVHLVSPRDGLNAARWDGIEGMDEWRINYADRLGQADALIRDLAGHRGPLIIAGDLNAAEHSPVVQRLLRIGLRDAFSSAGIGFGYTHGHKLRPRFSFLRIDHILVSREIGVRKVTVGGGGASEHRPVIADLWLNAAPPR